MSFLADTAPLWLFGALFAMIFGLMGFLSITAGNERTEFSRQCLTAGGTAYISADMHICIAADGTVKEERP